MCKLLQSLQQPITKSNVSTSVSTPTMTLIDIEPTSPQPSPERQQLDRINAAIDQTLAQLETTSQHVMHTIAHVLGIKWYQKSTHHIMSYQRWREIQQQLSKLTYTCGGIDEALMRHLFSLDAIMGDDSIRILRRTSVHRIKHAISGVEILTKYMYKLQYWWKKWIKHESEQQQQQDEAVPMEPATPTSHTTPAASSASPSVKSTKLPSKSPQPSSRPIPSSPKLTKAAKAKKSLQKQSKSPAAKSSAAAKSLQTKSPLVRPTSAKTPPRSPALTSRGITSASPSPLLPKRHIDIPTQPVRPPPSSPRFHVQTTADGLVITATLPDVQRDSLDITVRGHLLRIAGVSQGEPFLREMELPENADVDRLDASWQQDADVLRIEVPLIRKKQPPPPPPPSRPTYQDDDMDVDQYHPYYYQKPSPYRCAPSYSRPTYPRRPVYTQPPRSMFGSPFGFW